jgi:hypothetical protein
VGAETALHAVKKRNILPCRESNSVQPVAVIIPTDLQSAMRILEFFVLDFIKFASSEPLLIQFSVRFEHRFTASA